MDWYIILAVIAVGIIAGFINTLAGSGSLLTLPLLMFLGLPANVANGTNRIGILLQSLVGVFSFKQQKVFEWKQGLWLTIPAIIGSLAGAQVAVLINKDIMEKAIGGLMLAMFLIIIYKPEKWIKGKAGQVASKPGFLQILIFLVIGFYGGFIQAGVGFFLLAGLVLGAGFDLVKANAIKLLIVLFYTPFALAVFIMNHQVDYLLGFILAAGSMIGAYIATKVAVKWGAVFIHYILLVVILASAVEFIGLFDWIISLFI